MLHTEYPDGKLVAEYNGVWDSHIAIFRKATKQNFLEYLDGIARTATVLQKRTVKGNVFCTLTDGKNLLAASYTSLDQYVRLVLTSLEKTGVPAFAPQETARVTEPCYAVLGLDYSHRDETDGNGMGEVYVLSDGSYLVWDGGYDQDAAGLYRFLKENNRRPDGKIVIAAWVLTHSHPDHYSCLYRFAQDYAQDVTVERFLADPPSAECMGDSPNDTFLERRIPEYAGLFGAEIWMLHCGEKVYVRDAELEVLCGFEECLPATLSLNSASLMIRVTLGGVSVLMCADGEASPDRILPLIYGNHLKSDIIQMPHHSYAGGSIGLVDLTDPAYAVFTTNEIAFQIRIKDSWIHAEAQYVYEKLGNERCIRSDGGDHLFLLRQPLGMPKTQL